MNERAVAHNGSFLLEVYRNGRSFEPRREVGCLCAESPVSSDTEISTMTEPAYPAARAVALKIQPHFARHLAAEQQYNQPDLAPQPNAQDIEAIVDAAFW